MTDLYGQRRLICVLFVRIGDKGLFSHIAPHEVECHSFKSPAQLDARPTGDQEVAVSTPTGSATFFRRDRS